MIAIDRYRRFFRIGTGFFVFFLCFILSRAVFATEISPIPAYEFNVTATDDPAQVVSTLQILFMFSIIALAPSILLMMTCFTRILISVHFVRAAMGTQQMPPNQILIGLTLFVTLYIMGPTLTLINETAIQPYANGDINQIQAIETGMRPLREFMISQAEDKDIALFLNMAGEEYDPNDPEYELPNRVLIPAFMIGEVTKGFKFGVVVYLPFIAIDMVVASILMAMGMMMLPPAMISMPFKILLFVMVDGWTLIIGNLIKTFR